MPVPVVEFALGKGSLVFYGVGSNSNDFRIGQRIPIAYRKSDPETAFIRTFGQKFFAPLLIILLSSPVLLIGVRGFYVVIRDWRDLRPAKER